MKPNIVKSILASAIFLSALIAANATSTALKFDKQVHDFGQVLMSKGPVKCTFTARNISSTNVVIQSVTTSCGCTVASWPHQTIAPGATAKITATYSNDEGPYPFDKTLTVKLVGGQTPILLHIRGISQEEIKPDREIYTTVFADGILGMLSDEFKLGNLQMGTSKQDQTTIANFSDAPANISFAKQSKHLVLELKPNPIPAHARATLYYTVTAASGIWGWNDYCAGILVNGRPTNGSITIRAFTAENFSNLTKEQKALGSKPVFKESSFSFGHKKKGTVIDAKFFCENKGKETLKVHKADTDHKEACPGVFNDIESGQSGYFHVRLDTKNLPCGEALIIVTLTTNSPLRPVVNLFIAGWID